MLSSSGQAPPNDVASASTLSLLLTSPTLRSDHPLLCWLVASEERAGRQTVCAWEAEERREVSEGFCRVVMRHVQATPPLASRRMNSGAAVTPRDRCVSSLECLAAMGDDDVTATSDEVGGGAPREDPNLSALLQRLLSLERTVAQLTRSTPPKSGTDVATRTLPVVAHSSDACSAANATAPVRVHLDHCLSHLDNILDAQSAQTHELPSPHTQHPYGGAVKEHVLSDAARRRHVLAILTQLRAALRSVQTAYVCATRDVTPPLVALESLLQLPPETLPLLTTANVRGERPAWCTLFTTVSLFTLWAALRDGEELYDCLTRNVVDTLWAAVLWMHANAPPPPPQLPSPLSQEATRRASPPCPSPPSRLVQHTFTPAEYRDRTPAVPRAAVGSAQHTSPRTPHRPTLSSSHGAASPSRFNAAAAARAEEEEEERWAYHDFPVRRAYTAPTVYDALFPLPTAVSAFTEPSQLRRHRNSDGVLSTLDEGERRRLLRGSGVEFYTGPARRPQSLS